MAVDEPPHKVLEDSHPWRFLPFGECRVMQPERLLRPDEQKERDPERPHVPRGRVVSLECACEKGAGFW
jgi:hypothetical protein